MYFVGINKYRILTQNLLAIETRATKDNNQATIGGLRASPISTHIGLATHSLSIWGDPPSPHDYMYANNV